MTLSAHSYIPVTPHNTVDFAAGVFEGIYIGVAGDVTVVDQGGTAVLFSNVPVGILPVRGKRINVTGTSATNMVALYFKNPN